MTLEQQPNESFDKKYRPQKWSELIGQEEAIASLQSILAHGGTRCFLIHGPTGVGKTTAARLIARDLGCFDAFEQLYFEHDAGQFTGIESIKERIYAMQFKPMIKGRRKVIFIDEFHRLSNEAMQCLLKPIEEPPPHGYWIFATTAFKTIPRELIDRCTEFKFVPVAVDYMAAFLFVVGHKEGLHLDRDAIRYIAEIANGCPRRALSNMEQCRHLRSLREVQARLPLPEPEEHVRTVTRRRIGQGRQ